MVSVTEVFGGIIKRYGAKGAVVLGTGILLFCIGGGAVLAYLGGNAGRIAGSQVNLQKGLVGYWKLDGNAKDSSAYRNNGTVYGSTVIPDRAGKLNSAYSFNGTSTDYISVPNFDYGVMRANAMNASWTMSIWARWNGTNGNERVLLGRAGCNGGIYTYSNKYAFAIKGSACWTGAQTIYANVADTSTWHLLTATYAAGAMTFYADGVVQGTATLSDMTAYGTLLGIGSTGSNSYNFNGLLDDARVYNRAISATEVKALYDQYDPGINTASGEKGLVGYWKLDGNAKDSTPNRNNGIITGATPTTDRKGKVNGAYNFDGTSSIMIPDSPVFDIGASGMTYAAWIRPTAFPKTYNMFMGHHLPYFEVNSGRVLHFSINAGGAQRSIYGTTQLSANTWYYAVATYDSSGYMRIYLNGVQDAVGGPYIGAGNYNYNQYIGHWNGTADGYNFTGAIDDVRVYNRALAPAEITRQYGSYDSQINLNSNTSTTANIYKGLVGYWPFSGNANDSTPYRNNGTVTGATLTTDRQGKLNSAYYFNGTNAEIAIADSPALSPTSSFTLSAWVKGTVQDTSYAPSPSGGVVGLIDKDIGGSAAQNPPYGFQVFNGTLSFVTTNSVNGLKAVSYGGLLDNTWYHIVGTFDGANMTLYVNGVLRATTTQTDVDNSTGALRVGQQKSGFNRYFKGVIDGVRIYNRALSLSEVQILYGE